MTFYLKYRPQTFEELDLTEVREQLSQMVVSGKLPHAFLFSGPRGLGKTSAARILAKAVNCQSPVASHQLPEKKKSKKETGNWQTLGLSSGRRLETGSSFEPCNKCEVCVSITRGSAFDLIEIDAASNRGIDDIRVLKEKIKTSPVALAKKVYVIDEVHMLTREAFNALLKTLEEPPEHAFFILATTEPQRLPETVISRCMHIKFRKATPTELARSLERIVVGEKLKLGEGLLEAIAKKADGSFRDAAKILEQLSFLGKKINKEDLKKLRGGRNKDEFLEALRKRDVQRALLWIQKADEEGLYWKDFLVEFLEDLRGALLSHFNIVKSKIEGFSLEEIKELIKVFTQAGVGLKNALVGQLPIELAVIEYCEAVSSKLKAQNSCRRHSLWRRTTKPKLKAQNYSNSKIKDKKDKDESLLDKNKKDHGNDDSKDNQIFNSDIDLVDINHKWEEVLKNVKPQNHSVEALLRSARPKAVNGKSLIVEVFYEFHRGRLETEKCRRIVEESLQKVLNKKLRIAYVLGDKQKRFEKEIKKKPKKTDEDLVKNVEEIFK